MYRALLLTGIAGVGKTTVAQAAGRLLTASGRGTAVVDTDVLAQFGPPPPAGPGSGQFYDRLKCANLAAVWANFKVAGARLIVVAAVIEEPDVRGMYARCLSDCETHLVRLTADDATVRDRLRRREEGTQLERHLSTLDSPSHTPTLNADLTVTNDRSPDDVATEILIRAGWSDEVAIPGR
ncbi:AAA family ATPase [Actinoplanes sp. M2I2]|uniref:AAA family ATPase n=1 Tax=Actinoplanes sp. M2I2 TaxID=1734444 RepID=UPI002020E34F|nr:AAA family ATPase [Actinoplanes sp. M2I2]